MKAWGLGNGFHLSSVSVMGGLRQGRFFFFFFAVTISAIYIHVCIQGYICKQGGFGLFSMIIQGYNYTRVHL